MKVKLVCDMEPSSRCDPKYIIVKNGKRIVPAGTVMEGPKVHQLIKAGVAEPACDQTRAIFTPDQVQQYQATGHMYWMRNLNEKVREAQLQEETGEIFDEPEEGIE